MKPANDRTNISQVPISSATPLTDSFFQVSVVKKGDLPDVSNTTFSIIDGGKKD